MDPAASIEFRTSRRLRARVRLDSHPAMEELTVITFTDGDGQATVELALSPENLGLLSEQITARLAQVGLTGLREVMDGETA